jgi:hypothetical protein
MRLANSLKQKERLYHQIRVVTTNKKTLLGTIISIIFEAVKGAIVVQLYNWAFSGYKYSKNAVTKMQFHNFATSRLPYEL